MNGSDMSTLVRDEELAKRAARLAELEFELDVVAQASPPTGRLRLRVPVASPVTAFRDTNPYQQKTAVAPRRRLA